jgi:hypothetical protein
LRKLLKDLIINFLLILSLGELVLAKFEGEWFRAVAIDPTENGIIVQYLEYGNLSLVKKEEIIPCSPHLRFDICARDFVIESKFTTPSIEHDN